MLSRPAWSITRHQMGNKKVMETRDPKINRNVRREALKRTMGEARCIGKCTMGTSNNCRSPGGDVRVAKYFKAFFPFVNKT